MPASIRFGRAAADSSLSRTVGVPSTTTVTLMCWFKVLVAHAYGSCFCLGTSSAAGYHDCGTSPAGTALFYGNPSATEFVGSAVPAARWFHAAWTIASSATANTVLVYLNGALDITATPSATTSAKLFFGSSFDADYLNGCMAATKVWNRVLRRDEINAEIPFALPVNWDGLNCCYPVPTGWDQLHNGLVVPRGTINRWTDWSGNGWQMTEAGLLQMDAGPPIG